MLGNCAKTAEPTVSRIGGQTPVGSRNLVLDGVETPMGWGSFERDDASDFPHAADQLTSGFSHRRRRGDAACYQIILPV